MGATTFMTVAKGKTCQAAFDEADRQARFECGNGGYTGTIAEKYGYVEMPMPNGLTAQEVFDGMSDFSFDEQPRPLTRTVTYTRRVTIQAIETRTVQVPVGEPAPVEAPENWGRLGQINTRDAVLKSALKWRKTEAKPQEWEVKAKRAQEKLRAIPNVRRYAEIFDDKWGPALAVQSGPDEWTFMGYASC